VPADLQRPRKLAMIVLIIALVVVIVAFILGELAPPVGNIFSSILCSGPGSVSSCGSFIQTEVAATHAAVTLSPVGQ
jgi:hypothetical protein